MPTVYRFGEFRFDPAARELWRGDEELVLPLKVFECIAYLVEHRDRAIGRDELISAVWGKLDLTDSTLSQMIRQARQALGDNGDDGQVIKTIRGFGYRWVAPVTLESHAVGRRAWWSVAAFMLVAVLGVVAYWAWWAGPDASRAVTGPVHGRIALLLPVNVEADAGHAWVRLGLMDMIAERLREAGQAMVPGDTVIALLQGIPEADDGIDPRPLMATTGAGLVLGASAQVSGTRWTVSVYTLGGVAHDTSHVGEAHDVLEAARIAADRMAAALGLTPAPRPDTEPALSRLLQQLEAARLAQQLDVARELIDTADPALRRHPEVRFQQARVAFDGHQLNRARTVFEALLDDADAAGDAVFRARVLNGLAAAHASDGDWRVAEPLMTEAIALLEADERLDLQGTLHMNLGNLAQERGDFEAARAHMAQARRVFLAVGDVPHLAMLDANVGVLETRNERYAEARRHFAQSAERYAAVRNVVGELLGRDYMMQVDLLLLDARAALAQEPRLAALAAQTTHPELAARANLTRAAALEANGHVRAARGLLDDVLAATRNQPDLAVPGLEATTRQAEHELANARPERAAALAAEVVERLATDHGDLYGDTRARAWLVLIRARQALDDRDGAAAAVAAIEDWANGAHGHSPAIHAALAAAERAADAGNPALAGDRFERALRLAEDGRVPLHMLRVAQSYVTWLLSDRHDRDRALRVADRLADYADQHYEVALLQLMVYQALGPPSAWRIALSRAQALAGERRLPQSLEVAP